jgi:CHAT domain-containing protein
VRAALPKNAVLIDFLEYWARTPKPAGEPGKADFQRRLLAFVILNQGEVKSIDLGPTAPLGEAIDRWREGTGRTASAAEAGRFLRDTIWRPIEERIAALSNDGGPPIGTVLISPDGSLGQLPLAALPGKAPGTYLLEEWAIATVPSPQALVSLFRSPAVAEAPDGRGGNLLVLGGVDYNSRSGESAPKPKKKFLVGHDRAPRDEDEAFGPLSGTRGELATLERMYRDTFGEAGLTTLSGAAATEDALRGQALGHLYLHLATHGFFASPRFRSALDRSTQEARPGIEFLGSQTVSGYHPGLLSGLALAGANQPQVEDDGILTAEEVSTLNLARADLVVLSACQTGLGKSAGGEGLLGLQRSFHCAGARTVIGSLWRVDDVATRDLMERFYENLWDKDLGKLEALREAQLWMLRERGPRGLKPQEGEETASLSQRLPPYYWGAFILSGDWR